MYVYRRPEPRQGLILHRVPTATIRTTNEEAAAWAENTAFRREILSTPWVVSEKDEKRAKRNAEGLDREKRAREEREKRKRREEEKGGKRAATEKEKRRGERTRRGQEQVRKEDEAGVSKRRGNAEHRHRRRDVEKAERPKSEVSES